jgi:hypothetical protein
MTSLKARRLSFAVSPLPNVKLAFIKIHCE